MPINRFPVAQRDPQQESEDSLQLERFRVCDFDSAMDGELGAVFSRSDGIELRHLSLVKRIASDRAKRYIKRPTRTFTGSAVRRSGLEDVYRNSDLDLELLTADQKAQAQNSVVLAIDPAGPRRVRMHSYIPAEVEIESRDLLIKDIRDADAVRLRVPLHRDVDSGLVSYGWRTYTRSEAWTEAPNGERVGVFNEAGTNPFGMIPLVWVRLEDPEKGFPLPAPPKDLLSVQIGMILGISHCEDIVRVRAGGREVVTGEGARAAIENLEAGHRALWGLEGDDITYQSSAINPPVEKYLKVIETTVRLLGQLRYANTEGLWSSTGITGDAKEIERLELIEDQHRQESIWKSAEQKIAEVVAMVTPGVGGTVPAVSVDYHYVTPQRNDLQVMQSRILGYATGVRSAIKDVKIDEGLSTDEEAEAWIVANLENWRALIVDELRDPATGQVDIPGLDEIAGQVIG